MKYIYSGNLERLSTIVEEIKSNTKLRFFPSNDIISSRIRNNSFIFYGIFFKAVGDIEEKEDLVHIDLKVKLRWQITFMGLIFLIFLIGFIGSDNVTINGDSDPSNLKRIGFIIGFLAFLSIPTIFLFRLKKSFEKKIRTLIK